MPVSRASSAGSSVSTTAKPPGPSTRPKNCKYVVPSAGDHLLKTCRDRAWFSSVAFERGCQETTYFMLGPPTEERADPIRPAVLPQYHASTNPTHRQLRRVRVEAHDQADNSTSLRLAAAWQRRLNRKSVTATPV